MTREQAISELKLIFNQEKDFNEMKDSIRHGITSMYERTGEYEIINGERVNLTKTVGGVTFDDDLNQIVVWYKDQTFYFSELDF